MNKILKYILIIGFISISLLVIILLNKYQNDLDNRPFKKIEFRKEIRISNNTEYTKLDTILYVGLCDLYHINYIEVYCYHLSPEITKIISVEDYEIYAFVEPFNYDNLKYKLFITKGLKTHELIKVISHEIVHIKQYYFKELYKNNKYIVFNDHFFTPFDLKSIDYKNRPWEEEAYSEQKQNERNMKKYLY